MTPFRVLVAVALLIAATCRGFAADVVFPPGAHVGMKPLVGLVRAKSFIGFETEDQGVKVLIADLPAADPVLLSTQLADYRPVE